MQEPTGQVQSFETLMAEKLAPLLYLKADGFDSKQAFLCFEVTSLKAIENMLKSHHSILKNTPGAKVMYGMVYDVPEKFIILPGHKSQILTFVNEVKQAQTK